MLHVGHASSTSCNVFAVWRPCYVQVVPVVCHVMCLLSGDHASCGLCQQHVMFVWVMPAASHVVLSLYDGHAL